MIAIKDLEELHEDLLKVVLRKYGNWPMTPETKWRAEDTCEKYMRKWLQKNAKCVSEKKHVWELQLELPSGEVIVFVTRRLGAIVKLSEEDGIEIVPVLGSYLL